MEYNIFFKEVFRLPDFWSELGKKLTFGLVAAGGDSIVNNDDEEDEKNTPFGLDLIVKVTHTSVAMRKSPVKSSVKVVPVERGIHRIISFIFFKCCERSL